MCALCPFECTVLPYPVYVMCNVVQPLQYEVPVVYIVVRLYMHTETECVRCHVARKIMCSAAMCVLYGTLLCASFGRLGSAIWIPSSSACGPLFKCTGPLSVHHCLVLGIVQVCIHHSRIPGRCFAELHVCVSVIAWWWWWFVLGPSQKPWDRRSCNTSSGDCTYLVDNYNWFVCSRLHSHVHLSLRCWSSVSLVCEPENTETTFNKSLYCQVHAYLWRGSI